MVGGEFFTNYGTIQPKLDTSLYPKLPPNDEDTTTFVVYDTESETKTCHHTIVHRYIPISLRKALGVHLTSWLLTLYVVFYLLYLTAGALIFSTIETPPENQLRNDLRVMKMNFLTQHPCVSDEALEKLITEVVAASNRGVSAANNVSGSPNWSFGQSLFFSSTVITTIGYGHVTPLSQEGKIFCMIYALFGIPLTLVLLTALVERLLVPSTWLLQTLNSRLGHLYQPFNIQVLHLCIIVLLLAALFLCTPAAIFALIEPDWDFLDSFYYCFISLTTIGLGDYIPGDSPNQPYRPLYKVGTTAFLLIGLTFMMLTLTIFYDIPQLNLGTLFAIRTDCHGELEKVRLASDRHIRDSYGSSEGNNGHRAVVRVRSRRDDSPSPEDTTPVHAKDMLVP
ncbi:potassium channel subfamily K member 1-like [Chrysoperla carnea]|uniref:potassium channel subfamily K member 1-like n=1 Tax=Chrysoperla carnea TaxID=189513 RepID=UPI001D076272|nr:potassium channel subfamily K member 1-like [Chrysoperla carnea]